MSKLNRTINRETLEKPDEFSVLPKGKYDTIVSKTDYKIADSGRETIELQFKIINGAYVGRLIFASITMAQPLNPNLPIDEAETKRNQALSIGEKTLNSLMTAVDLAILDDTNDFLNKKVTVEVKVTPARGEYAERNDIVRFHEYTGDTLPQNNVASRPSASVRPVQNNMWGNVQQQNKPEAKVQEEEAPGARPW